MSKEMSSTACTRPISRWKMIPRVIGKYFLRLRTEMSAPSAGGESEPTEAGVETLMGRPLAYGRVGGGWGNREVPPRWTVRRGLAGETWFLPRERAGGE